MASAHADDVGRSPARISAGLAAAIALGAAFVVGSEAGLTTTVVLGAVGAVFVTLGLAALDRENNAFRAAGSFGVVVGSVLVVGAIGAGASGAPFRLAVAVAIPPALVATALGVLGVDRDSFSHLFGALKPGIAITLLAGVVAAAVHSNSVTVPFRLAGDLVATMVTLATRTDLALATALLVVASVTVVLGRRTARAIPDAWLPESVDEDARARLRRVGDRLVLLSAFSLVTAVLLVAPALTVQDPYILQSAVSGVPLGGVLYALVTTTAIHATLATASCCMLVGLYVRRVYHRLDRLRPDHVGDRLARATGGLTLVVVGLGVTLVVDVGGLVYDAVPAEFQAPAANFVSQYGSGSVALFGLLLVLVVAVGFAVGFFLLSAIVLPEHAGGMAAGSGSLFVAALATSQLGASPVVVLGAAAASLLLWDLGEYATDLGLQLGNRADTKRAELAHGGASAIVAGGAVTAAYAVGKINQTVRPATTDPWLLLVALVCSLFAAMILLTSLRR